VKVFLVHGMGRSPASLLLMRRRLARAGFEPRSFSYWVSFQSFDRIVARFVEKVTATVDGAEPYGILGHSLGGVIARAAWPSLPRGLSRLVMLGTPNRPSTLARRLAGNPVFRLLTGDAGRRLGDPAFFEGLPVPEVPTLVLAGTAGPRAEWLPLGDVPSDGVVTVEETRLDRARHVEVGSLHTFIMNSGAVSSAAASFLVA